MKIGELARLAACPVETVRYYEREQLLPAAIRDQNNNYRHYDKRHLEQLVFIRRCRSLEMTHDEIRELLAARSQTDAGCSAIDGLIQAHLEHVRTRMVELQALEAELNDLRGRCDAARATRHCGILHELDHQAPPAREPTAAHGSHVAGRLHGSDVSGSV